MKLTQAAFGTQIEGHFLRSERTALLLTLSLSSIWREMRVTPEPGITPEQRGLGLTSLTAEQALYRMRLNTTYGCTLIFNDSRHQKHWGGRYFPGSHRSNH